MLRRDVVVVVAAWLDGAETIYDAKLPMLPDWCFGVKVEVGFDPAALCYYEGAYAVRYS